jgi:hypothetical protein
MNWLQSPVDQRPALPTRERMAGKLEAQCPACSQWRPAFTIAPVDQSQADLHGHEWACDGDRTRWART